MAFPINKETRYILIYYHRVKYNDDALCWNWRKNCVSKIALNPNETWKEQEVVLWTSRWVVGQLGDFAIRWLSGSSDVEDHLMNTYDARETNWDPPSLNVLVLMDT